MDAPLPNRGSYAGRPRSWNSDIHPSWLPNLQILNQQIRKDDPDEPAEAPDRFYPSVSQTTGLNCYGLKITNVAKVESSAFKAQQQHHDQLVIKDLYDDVERYRQELCSLSLQYFAVNKSRLCTGTYPLGGSRLMAFIQTVYQRARTPDKTSMFSGLRYPSAKDTLGKYPSINISIHIMRDLFNDMRYKPTSPPDLSSMGLESKQELWDYCLGLDLDDTEIATLHLQSNMKLLNIEMEFFTGRELPGFMMEQSLFDTTCGLTGGGPPLTEAGDMVYLIHGSELPVLLREVEGKLRNIGICYIHGLAGEDAVKILTDRESDIREINTV